MNKEYTIEKMCAKRKDGTVYLKFYASQNGKFIKFLSKKELNAINKQCRDFLAKNVDKVWDLMYSGKSLGEVI